jgi:hypothetical protein
MVSKGHGKYSWIKCCLYYYYLLLAFDTLTVLLTLLQQISIVGLQL